MTYRRTGRAAAIHRSDHKQHVVYELYDRFGEALYVGCTHMLPRRLTQHEVHTWWSDVHEIHARVFPDKITGQAEELRLIHALQPRYNTQGTERHSESAREIHRLRREGRDA